MTYLKKKDPASTFHQESDTNKVHHLRGLRQREKILRVAASLFSKTSYSGTSIEDIAQGANINRATIYYYFENKSQLLYEIFSRHVKGLTELAIPTVNSDLPPEEKLRTLITNHISSRISNKSNIVFVQLARAERGNLPPNLLKAYIKMRDEYEDIVRKLIGEIMAQTGSQFSDPKLATILIMGMLNSTSEWYKPKGGLSVEEVASKVYKLIASALEIPA